MQVMSNGRVRRTEGEWRDLLDRWQKSGSSARAFCRSEKLQISSFERWRQKLTETPSRTDFVPIVAVSAATTPPSSWTMEVTLPNGAQLRFQG